MWPDTVSLTAMAGRTRRGLRAGVSTALALCTGDPRQLTSRIAHSLPLLLELGRPVYTLDGATVYGGWTPDPNDPRMAGAGYLTGH